MKVDIALRGWMRAIFALSLLGCAIDVLAQQGPTLLSVVSRRTHGSAGNFDLSVNTAVPGAIYDPLHSGLTIEPRKDSSSGGKLLIFNFSAPITSIDSVSVNGVPGSTLATGTATATFNGSAISVTLMGVADDKRVSVSVNNVNGSHTNYTAALGYLFGDVTQDGQVTGMDAAYVGALSPSATTTSNFMFDVDTNGSITGSDKAFVISNSPKALESAVDLNLISLWELRNDSPTVNDTFYTTYLNDRNAAVDLNNAKLHGVAAWVPCSSDTVGGPNQEPPGYLPLYPSSYSDNPLGGPNIHGYTTAYMNFNCAQPAGSLPLYRMYKGDPQRDHLYTTSTSEFNSFRLQGYSFDRVEGYVFASQVANSVPLYRLSIGVGTTSPNVEHRYTVSESAKQSLQGYGWTYEGITGYVFASYINSTVNATGYIGTYNGNPVSQTSSTPLPIQNVIPPAGQFPLGGLTDGVPSYQYGVFVSNTTIRPANTTRQSISFNFYSGTIFSTTGSGLNHIPIYLRYASAAASNQLSALPPYDGIALVIIPGGQLRIELKNGIIDDAALLTPMQNNTWYTIGYSLDDNANVTASVSETATGKSLLFAPSGDLIFSKSYNSTAYFSCPISSSFGTLSPQNSYCANPYSYDGFKADNTGYMIYPYFTGTANTTAQISNIQLSWQ